MQSLEVWHPVEHLLAPSPTFTQILLSQSDGAVQVGNGAMKGVPRQTPALHVSIPLQESPAQQGSEA
jgi:hypothetical protein